MSSSEVVAAAAALLMDAARLRAEAADDRRLAAEERRRAAIEREALRTDHLTGALTRREGFAALEHEIDRLSRVGSPLVIAFVDVDGLKEVNDTRGHLAGDAILRCVGRTLRGSLRSYDVVLRFGGDEFVYALTDTTLQAAEDRFDKMLDVIAATCGATLTAGFAQVARGESLTSALSRADADLYRRRRRSTA